ncbi:MAG: phage holin family protein, partial [Cutibacterium avidum]|nr:phage holin family protein [Cutibacterium avidum]
NATARSSIDANEVSSHAASAATGVAAPRRASGATATRH